jgi:hypothetical protein
VSGAEALGSDDDDEPLEHLLAGLSA